MRIGNTEISVEHPTDRPNFYVLTAGNLTVWFSYKTPIAFRDGWADVTIRENDWSVTTGKHLNYVDEDKRRRIDGDEFEQRLEAVLNRLNLTDTHPGTIVVNAR